MPAFGSRWPEDCLGIDEILSSRRVSFAVLAAIYRKLGLRLPQSTGRKARADNSEAHDGSTSAQIPSYRIDPCEAIGFPQKYQSLLCTAYKAGDHGLCGTRTMVKCSGLKHFAIAEGFQVPVQCGFGLDRSSSGAGHTLAQMETAIGCTGGP